MSKSHSKTTDSSPIKTKKDILEEINQLLTKGESYDKEIQILNNNKDKILKEQQSLKKIVQHHYYITYIYHNIYHLINI